MQRKKVFTVVLFSDIHYDSHDRRMWEQFIELHKTVRPDLTVLNGDITESATASKYEPEEGDSPYAVHDIRVAAREMNRLLSAGKYLVLPGNHDVRWHKLLRRGVAPNILRGAKGLTFSEQMIAQGLSPRWEWVFETERVRGVFLGTGNARTLIRHGDRQFRLGSKHQAADMLVRTPHVNQVNGHYHRQQLIYKTSLGKTNWAMTLGTFQKPRNFSMDADWQPGFGVLYFWGGDTIKRCSRVMPLIVPYVDGQFCTGALI